MGEKDMTEKTLMAYNDVFADIINALLFDGEQLVREDDLVADTTRSVYKTDGKLHEQERDVAKFWKKNRVRIALVGLENQTKIDIDIPLRIIGYDAASYRAQILDRKQAARYPVVTLVLYFGMKRWDRPRSLYESLTIPEELKVYVSDYKINVFEIAWLTPEQVKRFRSDFRIVADYFVQMRMKDDYEPSRDTLKHVHEVLQAMAVLTGDRRYEEVANEAAEKSEVSSMCEALDRVYNRGYDKGVQAGELLGMERGRFEGLHQGMQQGMQQGMAQGTRETKINLARQLMKSMNITSDRAMDLLAIPQEEREALRQALVS